MKNLTCVDWVRPFKVLLTSAVVSLTVINPVVGTGIPNTKTGKIQQAVAQLQKSDQRWIQINLAKQNLIAWEGNKPVYAITISSGKRATPTRIGTFKIQSMHKVTRMRGRGYDVPNVPYAMFYDGNYGIHGAYWHRRFGTPVSHGCVNLAPNHAKWLFNWSKVGTPVVIQK
ncbi:L,D-transpeptidase [Richelia sinica]|nr:L,D-transpeptidase [Richelia sinica]MBD2664594.1 L,D-transpeptidase [Richelia sinica FACHB-800]